MEFVRFIFSSPWMWLGFVVLVCIVSNAVAEVVKACKRNRKIKIYDVTRRWTMEIENGTREDVVSASFVPERFAAEPVLEHTEGAEKENQENEEEEDQSTLERWV